MTYSNARFSSGSTVLPLVAFLAASAGLLAACHASLSSKGARSSDLTDRPTVPVHEPCDETSSSTQKFDTNGDGKADIVSVFEGKQEVCRAADLNGDGKADRYAYLDSAGRLRRTESDYDRDGRIDEISIYHAGVIVRKDREMNLDGKIDTWDIYDRGQLVKRERDADGNGMIDQWWTFPNAAKLECAVVATDKDGDGKADVGSRVDMCNEEGEPASILASTATASASGKAPASLPAASPSVSALPPVVATSATVGLPPLGSAPAPAKPPKGGKP